MKKALLIILLLVCVNGWAQFNPDTVKAGRYDNGKMWTFDFPPLDYFEKTYDFRPTPQWLEDVRMSALRFATYCSASFVSSDGLIMTNHHCARESGTTVQKPGEDLNATGFVAASYEEERKVAGLFVDQLVKIEDITARVQKAMETAKTDEEKVSIRTQAYDAIKAEYALKTDWSGLELQTVSFYWGGRYSLYGFKRYKDIRLVAMPELALGFFGGDYDNFTYPRYCLDFSFFRAYDENGKPLKTPHFFKFNPQGAGEGEAVFVIGNPGSTNRQGTVAILEYSRNYTWPTAIKRFSARSKILQDYNSRIKSDSILNEIFSFENTIKALTGMREGLQDPYIFSRRKAFERDFKKEVEKNPKLKSKLSLWDDISATQAEVAKNYFDASLLALNGLNSEIYDFATSLLLYADLKESDTRRAEQLKEFLSETHKQAPKELERNYLAQHFKETAELMGNDHPYVRAVKGIKSKDIDALEYPKSVNVNDPRQVADELLKNTKLYDQKFRNELLEKGPTAILDSKDPMIQLAKVGARKMNEAATKNRQLNAKLAGLRSQLALLLFEVYGTSISPDATFSLRIADGVVKGYEYNGTKAPFKTTFYGMYDRYFSFNRQYPWDLPEKWKNPPQDLLDEPVDFVSTNDIIGGNSGSPMINRNKEAVGLIFDGNMESLPGNYIFMPELNRTVSVHAGGIVAALRYIYKSERLVKELTGN